MKDIHTQDSAFVHRLRAAGAILVGKTTMHGIQYTIYVDFVLRL